MNALDVLLVGLVIVAGVGGYRLGFVTRVLSWVGLLAGLVVAMRLLPVILRALPEPDQRTALVVTIAVVFLGSLLGQALGVLAGGRFRPAGDGDGGITVVDGAAGAIAGVVGMLAIVWLLMPVLSSASGIVARQATTSVIVVALDQRLPDPPDTVQALRTFVGEGNFPQVFEGLRETPDLGPPPAATGLDPATTATAAASTLRVEGIACDRIQHGSAFVVGPGLVMTNAHVVAGQRQTTVHRDDGRELDAVVVAFDPSRDIAVLAVPGLDREAMRLADSSENAVGAVFGHPGGGLLRIAPAQVARELVATGRDIYGRGGADREVLELAAELQPGDSGAPLVLPTGEVVGMVFAVATDRSDVAYALTTDEIRTVLASTAVDQSVSAGPCLV